MPKACKIWYQAGVFSRQSFESLQAEGALPLPAPYDLFPKLEVLRPPQAFHNGGVPSLFSSSSQSAFKEGQSSLEGHLQYRHTQSLSWALLSQE